MYTDQEPNISQSGLTSQSVFYHNTSAELDLVRSCENFFS